MPNNDAIEHNKQPNFNEEPPSSKPSVRTQKAEPRIFAAALVIMWLVTFPVGLKALTNYSPGSTEFSMQTFSVGANYWVVREKRALSACVGWINIELNADSDPKINVTGHLKLSLLNRQVQVNIEGQSSLSKTMKLESFEGIVDAGNASVRVKSSQPPVTTMEVVINTAEDKRSLTLPFPSPVFFVEEFPDTYSLRTPSLPSSVTLSPIENLLQANVGELFEVSAADSKTFETCKTLINSSPPLPLESF